MSAVRLHFRALSNESSPYFALPVASFGLLSTREVCLGIQGHKVDGAHLASQVAGPTAQSIQAYPVPSSIQAITVGLQPKSDGLQPTFFTSTI